MLSVYYSIIQTVISYDQGHIEREIKKVHFLLDGCFYDSKFLKTATVFA